MSPLIHFLALSSTWDQCGSLFITIPTGQKQLDRLKDREYANTRARPKSVYKNGSLYIMHSKCITLNSDNIHKTVTDGSKRNNEDQARLPHPGARGWHCSRSDT